MRKPEAILPGDTEVLKAFLSQLLLGQYTTGTIGKVLSYIVTNTSNSDARHRLVSRDGMLADGFEKEHK